MNKSYWVDLQVNGHAGVDYSSPDLTAEDKLFNPEKHCLVAAASTMGMCMDFLKNLQLLSEEECLKVGRKNALKLLKLAS